MNSLISPLYACISSFILCTLSYYRNLPAANQIKIISISEVSELILDVSDQISPKENHHGIAYYTNTSIIIIVSIQFTMNYGQFWSI